MIASNINASRRRPLVLAAALGATLSAAMFSNPARAAEPTRSFTSAYLVAKAAVERNDIAVAARHYRQAAVHRPNDEKLLGSAAYFSLLNGDIAEAADIADLLIAVQEPNGLTALLAMSKAVHDGDFDRAIELAKQPGGIESSPLFLNRLASAWLLFGTENIEAAQAALEPADKSEKPNIVDLFAAYHLGLMEGVAGRTAESAAKLEAFRAETRAVEPSLASNRRVVLASVGALAQAGKKEDAKALLTNEGSSELSSAARRPTLVAAQALLAAGGEPPLLVQTPREGVAEVFYAFASLIGNNDESGQQSLIYANLALYLRPDLEEARLLVGEMLLDFSQHESAARVFAAIPATSPYVETALLGQIAARRRAGKTEEALKAVDHYYASGSAPSNRVLLERASLLQSLARFDECASGYKNALAALIAEQGAFQRRDWRDLFGHGICLERTGAWDAAEARLRETLELYPDQPEVLNYLGYSLVEQRRKLDEALALIRKAVEGRPNSGHIVDSLGWALYRVGDYPAAVRELERAVELEPAIGVINDHLGDALWMRGRKMEARYQWKRALSLEDDADTDKERIRAKLDRGLDAVLAEEEAKKRAKTDAEDASISDN